MTTHIQSNLPPTAPVGMLDQILAQHQAIAPGMDVEIDCQIAPKELPEGYRLHHYTIKRTLGAGGFGVTYLAQEDILNRLVVIKENFPHSICYRDAKTLRIRLEQEDKQESYDWALHNFLRETRLLAMLDHPHIAKLYSYFEWNGMAYYVSEYINGQSIADIARAYAQRQEHIPQNALYGTLVRILDALDYIHNHKLLHRDIKPDNILVTRQGLPVIIDFGAAREGKVDATTIVESLGFSPSEQGLKGGNMGPWTDIYALGATMYFILTGECLPPSKQRELYDTVDPLSENVRLKEKYHPRLLASIDRAMCPHMEHRYQSVGEWMADLRA